MSLATKFKAYITDNATAEAADIKQGKTAYINGGLATGAPNGGGTQLIYFPPYGQAGAYGPNIQDTQYANDVTGSTFTYGTSSQWSLDAYGNAYSSTAWAKFIASTNSVPAYGNVGRMYQMHWRHEDATPTSLAGLRIMFNIADGSNYWTCYIEWTGSVFHTYLTEITALTPYGRANAAFSTAVDWPVHGILTVYDLGDTVFVSNYIHESDTTGDDDAKFMSYSTASRPHKTATAFQFGNRQTPTGNIRIRGVQVVDL